jgi:UDP-N-acetylmuramoylalanine--D-glutamate ligase
LDLLLAGGVSRSDIATFDDKADKADFTNYQDLLNNFKPSTLVVSPGVPLTTPWIKSFKGKVTSEISLAIPTLTNEKIIGVTGSVGKSTTVSILGAGVKSFSPNSFVGGNLGTPLSVYAKNILQNKAKAEWLILELSSYQLENCKGLQCDFSGVTYFTPNHLERYPDIKAYYKSKSHLIDITKQKCFLNFASTELVSFFNTEKNEKIVWSNPNDFSFPNAKLLGKHNQQNLALAAHVAKAAGWPEKSFTAMTEFPGLSHRLENLGTHNGILFVNDSKATTIESVKTAVESLRPSGNIILLCGGKDKNLPWDQLRDLKDITVIFFGDVASKAKEMSGLSGEVFPKLGPAVERAKSVARTGDIVLLSPGGTSLDEFKNFEERGNYFKDLV